MVCEKCGFEYNGDSCDNCNQNKEFLKKIKESFIDPKEELITVLGTNAARKFVSTGTLGNGFAFLTNKRVYFKGRCLIRKGKGFFENLEERCVDLPDVTGSGFVHNSNLITRILYYFFFAANCVYIFPALIYYFFYMQRNKKWAFYVSHIFPFMGIPLLFYIINRAFNYSVFEISFAGGGIAFDLNWIRQSDGHNFQKALIRAKDKYKKDSDTDIFYHSDDNNLEQLKKLKELFDIGAITEEEYNEKKKKLLNCI